MATTTTNISLTKPELSDTTKIREDINDNSDIIDGRFSATYMAVQAAASVAITGGSITGITDITVTDGGTGASTLTDGGVLLGSGTGAITAMAVLTDGQMIVGNGTTDPVAESGATLRTSIGCAATAQTFYIGTTQVAINRSSGALTLAGITLTTPNIGTPSGGTLTNCTGLPISTGVSGLGTGVATFLATPSSTNLASAVTGETGSGALVFATSPTLVTPALGTPASGTLTNCGGTASSLTAGAVTNATFTTALTVNTGTLTLTANVANTSVLTIGAGAVLVSGSNTGDQTNITGNAATVTVDATTSDTTCFVAIFESASGSLEPQTDATLTYNANTGDLSSTSFGGITEANLVDLSATENITGTWTFDNNVGVNKTSDTATARASYILRKKRVTGDDVASGDQIGCVLWYGYHTDGYDAAAEICGVVDGTPGNGDMPGRIDFKTSPDASATPSLRMAIKANGDIYMGDGAWTNYIKITSGGVMTSEGSASIAADTTVALATARTIGGTSFDGTANITVATATGGFTISGGNLALTTNSITMSGSIGVTGTRVTKLWATDIECTNAIAASITGTAGIATTLTVTDNESTNEANAILFTANAEQGGGNLAIESDGTLTYNPSTGKITCTGFVGALTGQADTVATITGLAPDTATTQAAQANITSLGTLTGLTMGGDITLGANSIGRDADNDIDFETDNRIMFRTNGADGMEVISSGELDMNANSVGFTQQTATGDGTTTIDWKLGNKFTFTFGAQNDTFTFTAPTNPCNLILVLIQDGTGSRLATFPTVKWANGTAPVLSTAAAAIDIVSFYYDGTSYYGVGNTAFAVP